MMSNRYRLIKLFTGTLNWIEIDNLTPSYRRKLENELSTQERKSLVAICSKVANGHIVAHQARLVSRIAQTNQMHTILGRLVKKGFLTKVKKSTYFITDKKLVAHILVRSCGVQPTI